MQKSKFNRGRIKEIKGNATVPEAGGLRYIMQISNNTGTYENTPFSVSLAQRWSNVKTEYRQWYQKKFGKLVLGEVQFIYVQSDTVLINMIAQDGDKIDEKSLATCLEAVAKKGLYDKGNFHIQKIDVDNWKSIQKIVEDELVDRGLSVTVYE